MKTLKHQFKPFFLLLLIIFSVVSCSKDDDKDIDENLTTGNAKAVIGVDNKTIQFSTKTDQSFATITKTKVGDTEFNQLTIVMRDDNSEVMIAAQVAPAPDKPVIYILSTPVTSDYFFTSIVAVDGKNSSAKNIYGVGFYQHEEEEPIQSKGDFKITSISNTTIKGTFDMTLYNSYDPNYAKEAKELKVSQGTFDLPIISLSPQELKDLGLE